MVAPEILLGILRVVFGLCARNSGVVFIYSLVCLVCSRTDSTAKSGCLNVHLQIVRRLIATGLLAAIHLLEPLL